MMDLIDYSAKVTFRWTDGGGGGGGTQWCLTLVTPWTVVTSLLCPRGFPSKNAGVGCHFLLQGIFLTQRSNPCLLHLLHGR